MIDLLPEKVGLGSHRTVKNDTHGNTIERQVNDMSAFETAASLSFEEGRYPAGQKRACLNPKSKFRAYGHACDRH